MGTVLITSNCASGASVSNSVKSWVSQNSPIFSSESALEMLLNLFSAIGLSFGNLRSKTIAVDAVLLYFVSEYSFGGIEQLRGALAVAAGGLERVLNEIAFIGADRSIERKARDGSGSFGSLQRRR